MGTKRKIKKMTTTKVRRMHLLSSSAPQHPTSPRKKSLRKRVKSKLWRKERSWKWRESAENLLQTPNNVPPLTWPIKILSNALASVNAMFSNYT
ncbi:unnamed protein product [Clavelina lepadiformis]|uniref:Uncharacterized protein n=1 Tax=Clavelina lepadiformis TaxID=159417 RepID=A0ABP0FMR6_CLALP